MRQRMLGNSIALIAIAAMFALEAFKVSERIPRMVLASIAVVFVLGGALLTPIVERAPRIGAILSDMFGEPVAWLILLVGLFFVLRPFWHAKDRAVPLEGLNGPADGQALAAYDDTDLRVRVDDLAEAVFGIGDKIDQTIETVARLERLKGALAEISELQNLPPAIALLDEMKGRLEKLPTPKELRNDSDSAKSLYYSDELLGRGLEDAGVVSEAEFNAEAEKVVASIRNNALNCTLEPGEEDSYASGAAKQHYLILAARRRLAARSVAELQARMERRLKAIAPQSTVQTIKAFNRKD